MKELKNLKVSKKSNTLVSIFVNDISEKNLRTINETFFSLAEQTYPVDVLVLHSEKFDEQQITSLKALLNSPKIKIREKDDKGEFEEKDLVSENKLNFTLAKSDISRFNSFVNYVFNYSILFDYEYFGVIEPGDIVGGNWYKTANEYFHENPEFGLLFPLIRRSKNGVFMSLMNEAPWAEGLSEEAGKIDLNLLTRFNCMNPLGSVIKSSIVKEYCEEKNGEYFLFKESLRLYHYYEFFMRMVYEDIVGYCIPRVGYEIREANQDFYNEISCKIPENLITISPDRGGISTEEAAFWNQTAKSEYFFSEDNNIEFKKSNDK